MKTSILTFELDTKFHATVNHCFQCLNSAGKGYIQCEMAVHRVKALTFCFQMNFG